MQTRVGAIVSIAMHDAYNGIKHHYAPVFYTTPADSNANPRAAVIAAAHRTLVALFPGQAAGLDAHYAASLSELGSEGGGGNKLQAGIDYGNQVADAVLAWRANDGFNVVLPPFTGGTAIGQWRPTPPAFAPMAELSVAFTAPWVVASNDQFLPPPPRGFNTEAYLSDFIADQTLGARTGSLRTAEQTEIANLWSLSNPVSTLMWNDVANQIVAANAPSLADALRVFALVNVANADARQTCWYGKRHYAEDPTLVTWRPQTAINLGDLDGVDGTVGDPTWLPLFATPPHPEYPAGHPTTAGAVATVLLSVFDDAQTFVRGTREYHSISQAREDAVNARVYSAAHFPSTEAASNVMGEEVANFVIANTMQRSN